MDFINTNYDHVLIHSDPKVIRLEDSFLCVEDIQSKLIYTGFIAKSDFIRKERQRKKQIIVFLGGQINYINYELLKNLIKIVPRFPQYLFIFVRGPLWSENITNQMIRIDKEGIFSNLITVPFIRNFEESLASSSLAITSSGTTIISLYQAQVPSIVFPLSDQLDQHLFSQRFQKKGIVTAIDPENSSPETLFQAISEKLNTPYISPSCSIDIDGVKNTCDIVYNIRGQTC